MIDLSHNIQIISFDRFHKKYNTKTETIEEWNQMRFISR